MKPLSVMPCTVKGKPLEKVCLGLAFRDICRENCDIMVVHSQFLNIFYLPNSNSYVQLNEILHADIMWFTESVVNR